MEMKISKSNELLKLKVDEIETNVAFEEISGAMRTYLEKNKKKVPSKIRHQLFAFYNQGAFGDCTMTKPSFFSAGGDKDRFTAWDKLKGMPMEEAQSQYI